MARGRFSNKASSASHIFESSRSSPTFSSNDRLSSGPGSMGGSKSEVIVEEEEPWSAMRETLAAVLESHIYEVLLALIIIGNAAIIIKEVDVRAIDGDTAQLEVIGTSFYLFYVVELIIRLYVYRTEFFMGVHHTWNIMDFVVVMLDSLGKISELLAITDEVPSVSVLRILRLCRLVRFFHILSAFKELHMMLHAFFSALRTIIWASFMLLVLLTLWSIVAVELIHPVNQRVAARGEYEDCDRCARAFRSVLESNLTFMQTIIAGDSWGRLAVPIIEEASWTSVILVTAFVSINLGILNLVLTVIVNAAQEARESDEKMKALDRLQKYQRQKNRLTRLLRALDEDKSGTISLEEMIKAMDNISEFRHVLEAIDIRKDDLQTFFNFLDVEGTGEVTYSDFVEQVFKVKSKDTMFLIMSLKNSLSRLHASLRETKDLVRIGAGIPPGTGTSQLGNSAKPKRILSSSAELASISSRGATSSGGLAKNESARTLNTEGEVLSQKQSNRSLLSPDDLKKSMPESPSQGKALISDLEGTKEDIAAMNAASAAIAETLVHAKAETLVHAKLEVAKLQQLLTTAISHSLDTTVRKFHDQMTTLAASGGTASEGFQLVAVGSEETKMSTALGEHAFDSVTAARLSAASCESPSKAMMDADDPIEGEHCVEV